MLPCLTDLAFHPGAAATLYAACQVVHLSTDARQSWRAFPSTGLPT